MTVFTQGTFDLFHIGHLNLLKRCSKLANGGEVIVGLLTDEAIEKYKGSKPIIPYHDRASILEACEYVDKVTFNAIEDIQIPIASQDIDLIVVGSDWAKKDLAMHYNVNKADLEDKLVYLPYTERESSTKIKERICETNR